MSGHNHYPDCTCGWCYKFRCTTGEGHKRNNTVERSVGNIREQSKVFVSYVNPSAYCPVCGASVFFYQSPHGGRVFFDSLGKPWEKHPCTDNSDLNVKVIPSKKFPTSNRVGKFKANKFNPFIIKLIEKFHITSRVKVSGFFGEVGIVIAVSGVTRQDFSKLEIDVNSPCMMRRTNNGYQLSFVNKRGEVIDLEGVKSN
ncbi:hypothetical protein NZX34_004628 [Vibrio parahaemolyticus]|uniref:hypothetical protein n=1 Tax=Vibrio parahaemolyticus TaxID=670 RepID=UPI00084A5D37|nr:hypothetical protein [Vibrio parahaemolyticus]EGQ7830892.1 hypothetical protein [Vibrio parahaemolyticus]EGQ9828821.1 hypothetical protein [Vibrio parahaemolyticus]EGR0257490.1 hypothetical protein [Vibrio parahaemolyticus]EHH1256184.1 hypothetical protein [Vibrio parahaemolyticus]EHR6658886.1 hypothetical protein [Vibrio parahaemolyticus]